MNKIKKPPYVADVSNDEEFESYINPNDYITFAFEANGNMTLYHKNNSLIIMFAHDYCLMSGDNTPYMRQVILD